MKKHFKLISKSILLSVVSSTMISSGLILSSCVNKKDDNESNDSVVETPNGEIKIEDQSPTTNEVSSDSTLTLYVNIASNKPVKYQWFVNKNNSTWDLIKDATQNSYNITSDLMQDVTTSTTWKYKAEIYDADDPNIKLTTKVYSVNIKPQDTTPKPDPNPRPEPNPSPGPNPEPNPAPPTVPDNNQSTSINSSSITLNDIGRLLPSQYLSDLNNLILNKSLIKENFNTDKIKNVSYKVNELNDQYGTLTIMMNYTEDNTSKSQIFNFTNLLNLESNSNSYHFQFENVTGILNLSAQEIATKTINNKIEFMNFVKDLENYQINFKFTYKGIKLPLEYLDLSSVNINGFDTKWFTTNDKLILNFDFKNLKINYYVKNENSNKITSKSFEYPSHINKRATMEFYSAVDYLLNKITNNSNYKTDRYSSYYYYDIIKNDAQESQVKVTNNYWLSNVTNKLTYNEKNYMYTVNLNVLDGVTNAINGALSINLKMTYQSDNSLNVNSQTSKDITITGFAKYNTDDIFSNSENVNKKFSLSCESTNYDNNIKRLKSRKKQILDKIKNTSLKEEEIIFTELEAPKAIITTLITSINCKFSGIQLIKQENKGYYSNDLTAIEYFYIDSNETYLRYKVVGDVFQLVIKNFTIFSVGINENNYVENPSEMIVNITHPGDSFQKLQDA